MNLKYILSGLILVTFLFACNKSEKITDIKDYRKYLQQTENKMHENALKELEFWTEKLQKTPNQFPYLSKIASANSLLFEATGNIDYLKAEEKNWLELNIKTNYQKATYLRALARNYITQHRFKESLTLLQKAEENGENLLATQKMLFDVHLELGNYEQAEQYLAYFQNSSDFDYLIRLSKWSDQQGDLDLAIEYMEKAMEVTESSKNLKLQGWAFTNLADFYGHAGRIQDSYHYYLKALELNPNDTYALKGIAWIVFSYERDVENALHITDYLFKQTNSPDLYLLRAEISEYQNDQVEKNKNIEAYFATIEKGNYGVMYNKYNTLLLCDEMQKIKKAMKIAKQEVAERPTPQSYSLLAWVNFKNGNNKKAINIMEDFVVNKSFEPEIQYQLATIYKADGRIEEAKELQKELLECAFELGPNMEKKIKLLL